MFPSPPVLPSDTKQCPGRAWTKASRVLAGKEMTVDSTLLFGARRNVPIRYSRELVAKTVAAMERIAEIRRRREQAFYKMRMAGNRVRKVAAARKLVGTHGHLLPRLRGSQKRRIDQAAAVELERQRLAAETVKSRTKVPGVENCELVVGSDDDMDMD